jgi:hypothetical protein
MNRGTPNISSESEVVEEEKVDKTFRRIKAIETRHYDASPTESLNTDSEEDS